jgi:hypothetical protein
VHSFNSIFEDIDLIMWRNSGSENEKGHAVVDRSVVGRWIMSQSET